MKTLILVESPTKAKTLTRFLQGEYDIEASLGHIRDLPKGTLGVDIENNFAPKYVVPNDKRKIVEALKDKIKSSKEVILATDPDREGEAIAYHLQELFKKETKNSNFKRIVFHEITKEAIEEALLHPRKINDDLVAAQTARRVLDRVVGYKLSPVLWKKIKRKLSAGRVQSVALRLIVEREKEINKFKTQDYSKIFVVLLTPKDESIEMQLTAINGESVESQEKVTLYDGQYKYALTNLNKQNVEEILKNLDKKNYTITNVIQKDSKRSPYPPFTTSTLTQEAYRRLGYSSKRTMRAAQRLYEEGYITYHRTDSFSLSKSYIDKVRIHIKKQFGDKFLSEETKTYQTKSKLAQEAHEAIRPTSTEDVKNEITSSLGKEFSQLYSLIYKRAIATQMSDAVYASTKITAETKTDGKTYEFETNGRILKFPGFLKIWYYEDDDFSLPSVEKGEVLTHKETKVTEHSSTPPPRYNEASLISSLEKHGIGRPSTYAPIISTIIDRFYVEKQEGRFTPTTIGVTVSDFLVKNFAEIDDIPFTSSMEEELDEIANGKMEWTKVLKNFYSPFEKQIEKAETVEKIEVKPETTGEKCPECGGDIVIRHSRFGKFYACSNFPNCTYKKTFQQETELMCPKDGGKVIIKRTRKGRIFFGCSNYPKCDFAAWKKEDIPQSDKATTE